MPPPSPIKINDIPDHVKFFSMKMKTWLRKLDNIADRGKSDGQFTAQNLRHFQRMGYFYLKKKYPYIFRFKNSNFATFEKFIRDLIKAQRCDAPLMKEMLKRVNKDREDPSRVFCLAPRSPFLPPRPRSPRIKPKGPHVKKGQKIAVPDPNEDIKPVPEHRRLKILMSLMPKEGLLIEDRDLPKLARDFLAEFASRQPRGNLWGPGGGSCGCVPINVFDMARALRELARGGLMKKLSLMGPTDKALNPLLNHAKGILKQKLPEEERLKLSPQQKGPSKIPQFKAKENRGAWNEMLRP